MTPRHLRVGFRCTRKRTIRRWYIKGGCLANEKLVVCWQAGLLQVHARSTAIMEHRASMSDEEPSRRSTSNLLLPVTPTKATDRSSSIFRALGPRSSSQPTHAPATERGAPMLFLPACLTPRAEYNTSERMIGSASSAHTVASRARTAHPVRSGWEQSMTPPSLRRVSSRDADTPRDADWWYAQAAAAQPRCGS